jgi:hypothetical protein
MGKMELLSLVLWFCHLGFKWENIQSVLLRRTVPYSSGICMRTKKRALIQKMFPSSHHRRSAPRILTRIKHNTSYIIITSPWDHQLSSSHTESIKQSTIQHSPHQYGYFTRRSRNSKDRRFEQRCLSRWTRWKQDSRVALCAFYA